MNRVQTVTQKYHRVENQFEKPSRMHEHPAGLAGTPRCALAPTRAHGRRIVDGSPDVSWQGVVHVEGPSGRIAASLPHALRASAHAPEPRALAPAPARPAHLLRAQRRIVAVCARRQGRIVACLATQPKPPHNTVWPTVLQHTPAPAS